MSTRQEILIGFVAIAVLAGSFYALSRTGKPAPLGAQMPVTMEIPKPPSAAVLEQLKNSHGFQLLVSYTDNGFEPSSATIKKGEAIRFVNNSSGDLWVAATGTSGKVYPGSGSECGQSAFDTCKALKRGDFWEFTFNTAGTWSYKNNTDTSKTGTIKVQ